MDTPQAKLTPERKSRFGNAISTLVMKRDYLANLYNKTGNRRPKLWQQVEKYEAKIERIEDLLNGKDDEQGDSDSDRVQS